MASELTDLAIRMVGVDRRPDIEKLARAIRKDRERFENEHRTGIELLRCVLGDEPVEAALKEARRSLTTRPVKVDTYKPSFGRTD